MPEEYSRYNNYATFATMIGTFSSIGSSIFYPIDMYFQDEKTKEILSQEEIEARVAEAIKEKIENGKLSKVVKRQHLEVIDGLRDIEL